ncbi:MAG: hypothetical protein WBV82_05065 [Myxococcaceae bacterium]
MTEQKSVLVIGFNPDLLDFSGPSFKDKPWLSAVKIRSGLEADEERLKGLGYDAETLLTDLGETAEAVVRKRLRGKRYDCVVVGAGVRTIPEHFLLFERLINLVHEAAPQARIAFNTRPDDIAEAVQRWV